ncbi:MAG: phosphate ABC transporter substrate-binding protein PstS [Scytonema sp. PMC 1069.18]|nr:phosphate ABC transporter substrate-binding protein PstS [Scytonema sp. PMC 1069.18]MEC4885464.1 phosphate ABC transporter substrate-binding protein PstS [Scytonema sp. PMC 1070.18]
MIPTTVLNRVVTASAISAVVAFGPIFSAAIAQQKTALNGAGATFPAPLYELYAREVRKKHPNLSINYQGVGSGAGIRQFTAGTVDFGGSDAAMTDEQMAQVKRGVILVPTSGGAVSVVYNLSGVKELKLSREALSGIFSGQIKSWDDAQIKKDNPGVNLPKQAIRPVVRADSSGTTFIFTNHLSAISPYFKGRIGASTSPKWTLQNVLKAKGNPGVANSVRSTPGSIGYVEYSFATSNKLNSAQIQNKQGQFVAPSLQTANQALSTVEFPKNNRVFVGDPGQGYPIVGMTWMLVYKNYPDAAKKTAMKDWITWVLNDGQQLNDNLNYTRVPAPVAQRVSQEVNNTLK